MFIKTKAFSRQVITDLIYGRNLGQVNTSAFGINYFKSKVDIPFCLISIVTNDSMKLLDIGEKELRGHGMREGISLSFGDIIREEAGSILFNEEHALKVVEFVREGHKHDGQEFLVVHCDAGIRRSGAVVTWASKALGIELLDPDLIWPNTFVLKMLEKVDEKK